jgi:hypothetical protein
MRQRHERTTDTVFSVNPGALLAVAGHATAPDQPRDPATVSPSPERDEQAAEIGLFVGGSTFVGHGVILDGTARLTVRHGLAGFVTLFVCVDGEIRGVIEALAGDDGSLVVAGQDGFVDLLVYLEAFGATATEIEAVGALDPDAAHRWMTSLAISAFVERRGAPTLDRRSGLPNAD